MRAVTQGVQRCPRPPSVPGNLHGWARRLLTNRPTASFSSHLDGCYETVPGGWNSRRFSWNVVSSGPAFLHFPVTGAGLGLHQLHDESGPSPLLGPPGRSPTQQGVLPVMISNRVSSSQWPSGAGALNVRSGSGGLCHRQLPSIAAASDRHFSIQHRVPDIDCNPNWRLIFSN